MPMSGLPLLKDSEVVLSELKGNKVSALAPRIFDEDKLRAHFSKYKGVDIISLRVTQEDDRIVTYFNIHVEDLRAVLRAGMLPYTSLEKSKDDYIFAARYPFNLSKLKEEASLKKFLSEIKVSFKVKTPTEITKTNAHKKIGNLAEWNFSEGKKNPSFMKADGRFIVQFKGKGLSFLDDKKDKDGN